MNKKQRFHATIERKPVDRPASWLGIPTSGALPALLKHFGASDLAGLKSSIDDDVWPVELPYHSPFSDAIYMAFDFAKKKHLVNEERTLNSPGFFEDISDPAAVADFGWPDPSAFIDPAECRAVVDAAPGGHALLGVLWSCHFQDACAAFGMETALMNMVAEPEIFRAVIARITRFYIEANEIFYRAAGDKLDAVLIGNDFGSQTCLMLSRELIREFAWPGTKALVEQAKSHGLKVIHHSCGAVRDLIPDLVEIGVDAIHPIQALATGMDAAGLARDFAKTASFCGGVDAQNLLVNGTPDEVRTCVRELRRLFPTGLVISPSHEAILPDIPPQNIRALFEAVHEEGSK
ncbi:MAG: uroporphyrinogen decarboxylase family protein, partial [Verrucomicrobiota bacterium]